MRSAYSDDSFQSLGNKRFLPLKPLRGGRSSVDLHSTTLDSLVGESAVIMDLKESIRLLAKSDETLLITGESGTGRELIAHAVHKLSARRNKTFLAVNCAALAESLLESELFGHVKGSFTGAICNKKGLFETANEGTIFLDEFAEMSLAMQQRLLRVLQEGTVRVVGSTDAKEIEVNTRVVVATNHDLRADVAEGKFRKDLYYRINVLEIQAPELSERKEDITLLAKHFIRQYNQKNDRQISEEIAPDVLAALKAYSWPGNVRELENIIKRLAVMVGQGRITKADLRTIREFDQLNSPTGQLSKGLTCFANPGRDQFGCQCGEELDFYRSCVAQVGGNLTTAARQLNIPRTTLRDPIKILKGRCARPTS